MRSPPIMANTCVFFHSSIDRLQLPLKELLPIQNQYACPCDADLSITCVTLSLSTYFPEVFAILDILLQTWGLLHTTDALFSALNLWSASIKHMYLNKAQKDTTDPQNPKECTYPQRKTSENSEKAVSPIHQKFVKWCMKIATGETLKAERAYFRIFRDAIGALLLMGRFLYRLPSISNAFEDNSVKLASYIRHTKLGEAMQRKLVSPRNILKVQNKLLKLPKSPLFCLQKSCFGFQNLIDLCRNFLNILRPTAPFPQGGKEQLASVLYSQEDLELARFPLIVGDLPLEPGLRSGFIHNGKFCDGNNGHKNFDVHDYMHSVIKHNQAYDPSILTRVLSSFFLFTHRKEPDSENPVKQLIQYSLLDQSYTQMLASSLAIIMMLYCISSDEIYELIDLLKTCDTNGSLQKVACELMKANQYFMAALDFISSDS